MATKGEFLAFFECQCRGVKFYQWSQAGDTVRKPVSFRRDPGNPHDPNCVEVLVAAGWKLGHIAKDAAQWLSPLLMGPFHARG